MGTNPLPLQLRGNDIQRHIINIDSRFRDSYEYSSASNFFMTLLNPIRNILRARITSFEFPNNYYMFTAKRNNVSFQVIFVGGDGKPRGVPIQIKDGSYTACELVEHLNHIFSESDDIPWLTVKFDQISGHFIFSGDRKFGVDTMYASVDRDADYGLGYYMGFTRGLFKAVLADESCTPNIWQVESPCQANLAGDSYVLMRLNDFHCVRQTVAGNDFPVFAKFILDEGKNYVTFDNYSGHHIKEVVFQSPRDLTRLHIQLLDPYGEILELGCSNFSFSLEVLEIKNLSLYNAIRNSLGTIYIQPEALQL